MNQWANEATFIVYKYITDEGELNDLVFGEAYELYHGDDNPMETLGDWLRDRIIYDDNPLRMGTLYFDLLESALREVDWYDIADTILRRVKKYDG